MLVYSFTKDRWTFTVKTDFYPICPNPEDFSLQELFSRFKLNLYLHNPDGPAVVRAEGTQDSLCPLSKESYWVNGQCYGDKLGE